MPEAYAIGWTLMRPNLSEERHSLISSVPRSVRKVVLAAKASRLTLTLDWKKHWLLNGETVGDLSEANFSTRFNVRPELQDNVLQDQWAVIGGDMYWRSNVLA